MLATYFVKLTGDKFAPVYYLIAMSIVSLVIVLRMRETANQPLR